LSTRRELYVYYRVPESQWRGAADTVMAWQRELCLRHPGLHARVLRRPEAHDAVITLMETYAGTVDAASEAELARGAPALRDCVVGERHVERFDTLD
jgi:hypothetical protein